MKNITRIFGRLSPVIVCLTICLTATAGPAADKFVASEVTNPATIAVLVTDLETGETVESYNAGVPLIPASIMKLVTIATTLGHTGTDYQYHTPVFLTGPIRNGRVEGNILVKGSGDPSLNSVKEPLSPDFVVEITEALKKKGITAIAGTITIDESIFSGPVHPDTWAQGDMSSYYGTGIHGFNFSNNAEGKSAVNEPGALFTRRLRNSFANAGITIEDANDLANKPLEKLCEHISPEIDEIMRSCMMRSDNMYAEALLKTFSAISGGNGSTSDGASLVAKIWKNKNIDMNNVTIVDGSGLSRTNRVTADFMTQVLRNMAGDVDFVSFFPLAGQEGTLSNLLKNTPLDSYIAMKTGSMKGIQCYAGYKLDDDFAPTHTVVIIVNNLTADRSQLKNAVSEMLLEIFADSPYLNNQTP